MTNWQINYANQSIGLFLRAVIASVSTAHRFTSNDIEQRTSEVVIKLFT